LSFNFTHTGVTLTVQALGDILGERNPVKLRRDYSRLLTRAARQTIMKEAKRATPKRTGDLRKSWVTTSNPAGNHSRYSNNNEPFTVVGSKPPGSHYLHFVVKGIAGKKRVPERPILRIALEKGRTAFVRKFQELLVRHIDLQVAKNKKR